MAGAFPDHTTKRRTSDFGDDDDDDAVFVVCFSGKIRATDQGRFQAC